MDASRQSSDPFAEARFVSANGIRLAIFEAGSGPPVLLVHGFPELAYSWRRQLPALAAAGYRAIAPDMRGYGRSDKPPEVADYSMKNLVGDLAGIIDALDLGKVALVGHDWGALIAWQMALSLPERLCALVALNIPFFPRPPLDPVALMRWRLGPDFYIVNFQDSDEADRRFDADPARFIDVLMRRRRRPRSGGKRSLVARMLGKRKGLSLIDLLDDPEPGGERLLCADELEVYAAAFRDGGFTGPINWYRNFTANWRQTRGQPQFVNTPTLFIGGSEEIVVSPPQIEAMKPRVRDLEIHMLEDCGHWMQQEKPDELNRLLVDWLDRRYRVSGA